MARSSTKRLALVGAESLLGREISEVLEKTSIRTTVQQFSATAEANFGEEEGEAVFRQALDVTATSQLDAILMAGGQLGAERCYRLVCESGHRPPLIDATGLLDGAREARIAAPILGPVSSEGRPWLFVVAHPAASALALLFSSLAGKLRIERAIAEVFEPASERGKRGIGELQQQTTSLLSFRPLDKQVFDAQLSFNLLPTLGEEADVSLEVSEQRIERHLATLLARLDGAMIPMPSLRLIQAPVFHGYSISVWIEFSAPVALDRVPEALASAQIEVRAAGEEAPTNVGVAGQSGIQVGDIRLDRNNPRAVWLWVTLDNLRLRADGVEEILLELEAEA